MRNFIAIFIITMTLSGCALFNPQDGLSPPAGMPSQFSMYSTAADHSADWWREFNNDALNHLMAEAIDDNFTIREAWARLQQARFAAIKDGANQYPSLSYQAGASEAKVKSKNSSVSSTDNWSLGLTANYEIDLWGRINAERESSNLLTQASEADLKAALMTVTGQIAENWTSLISIKQQQALFNRQLILQKKILDLISKRFSSARSTALDIYQQQQSIERIETSLIPLNSREQAIKRQIALLLGKASIDYDVPGQESFPEINSIPAIGLPADLLAARPDVRAAGLRLKSTEWLVTAAKADRLPALKLTGSHTYSSEDLSLLSHNWIQNLAANLSGPIFDGKRRQAEVERTKSLVDERLAAYSKTVFTAIKEVEDALADEAQYAASIQSLKRQLDISKKTLNEARRRYLNGSSDFLNVILQELNILQVEQNVITAAESMIIARVRLYRALGGSWVSAYTN